MRNKSLTSLTPFARLVIYLMLLPIFTGSELFAAEINVNPGDSIQAAVNDAQNGDTVQISAGTYTQDIVIENKTISLLGSSADTTQIQGTGTDSVITLINAGTTLVDGFTISGGTRSTREEYYDNGGGVYCSGGAPTISNCIIEDNDSRTDSGNELRGGGIFSDDADIAIVGNIIRNNHSGFGGGILIAGGNGVRVENNMIEGNYSHSDHGGGVAITSPNAVISGNTIQNNQVDNDYGWGGGIFIFGENAVNVHLTHNTVWDNFAPSDGGGVFIDDGAEAVLEHNLVIGNRSDEGGGGIYVDGALGGAPGDPGSTATIIHCTVADNVGGYQGGAGLYVEGNSVVTVKNSIFHGNYWNNSDTDASEYDDFFVDASSSLSVAYCSTVESIAGIGNTVSDPLFVNSDGGDYHLTPSSPAIDAADPASDYNSEPSPNGGRANMGRYGNTSEATPSNESDPTDPSDPASYMPTLSQWPDFLLRIPTLQYGDGANAAFLHVDFQFVEVSTDGDLIWKLGNFESVPSPQIEIEIPTLSSFPDFSLQMTTLEYETGSGSMDIWATFEFLGTSNGNWLWKLSTFGQN